MKTRVLIAEDHETVREGLRLLLNEQTDIEVVGEAADGRQALQEIRRLGPHVVVMDISMPRINGLAATRAVKSTTPAVAVIALRRHTDEAYVQELLAAGASGYVLKQSASSELLQAIRTAATGGRYLDSALVARNTEAYVSGRPRSHAGPTITDREASVLRMMAVGHSNKEIASELAISVKTVEVHKANAMRKLGLRGRIDVVRYAVLNGWLKDP